MLNNSLITLFNRELKTLKTEISAYKTEANLWLLHRDISNTAGNLALHLVGNLKTFIGATIGNSEYVRQRDLEFSLKDVPRSELLEQIDETMLIVEKTLKSLSVADLQKEISRREFEKAMSTEFYLLYLLAHLSYHLGQINYHRRLLD